MDFKPLFSQYMLYGADYNAEQWIKYPKVLQDDIKLMQEAKCNIMSVGIFAWSHLEKNEGEFDFSFFDELLDRLKQNKIKVFLATPSAARPAWLSHKYPEVLRVNDKRQRHLHGLRHNHCPSSPIYREKVKIINTLLAQRYAQHEAVIGWHLSNEYGGQCFCPLCEAKFRQYLKDKYQSLDRLNHEWWTSFWSHTYTAWEQIEAPSSIGENAIHGLNLDWQRFSSDNALDFCKFERDVVKEANEQLLVTTNFMEFFRDYDYFSWAKELDFVSWDSYPRWHQERSLAKEAAYTAMNHDLMRSLKGGKPFVLMESTPSNTNWQKYSTLKRPHMNILSSLLAIAHGADSIQYFQWRKSRGSAEKFHGAIVDHVGHLNTRVGKEVCRLGDILSKLNAICGSKVEAKVAIVFDTHNRWALEDAQGPRNYGVDYLELCLDYYYQFFRRGINVDVIDQTCPLDQYSLVIAPMCYMLREGFASKVDTFVKNGGSYVSTYWSGIVNENDLCFLNGFPGPLRKVLGVWEEEIDSLIENKQVAVKLNTYGKTLELKDKCYFASQLCALCHLEDGAKALAHYDDDSKDNEVFYNHMPLLCEHQYHQGMAYYVASRMDEDFLSEFIGLIVKRLKLNNAQDVLANYCLDSGLCMSSRYNEHDKFVFIGNFSTQVKKIELKNKYIDMLTLQAKEGSLALEPYQSYVLKKC